MTPDPITRALIDLRRDFGTHSESVQYAGDDRGRVFYAYAFLERDGLEPMYLEMPGSDAPTALANLREALRKEAQQG